ncbi:MAG: hypothetical protein IH876_02010 [Gemmatimonadetes bacterium]|nr:hypothetical protein [Gemmatimonadota bacterium]
MRVRRRGAPGGCELLYCEFADGAIATVPTWMTDAIVCSTVTTGEPFVEVTALLQVRTLLDALHASDAASVSVGVREDTHESKVEGGVETTLPASDGEGASATTGDAAGDLRTVRKAGARSSTKRTQHKRDVR